MDDVIEINPLSSAALYVEMLFNEEVLACGTAFYYRSDGEAFLVSNWHNFSGRDPATGNPMHSKAAIPNRIKVHDHAAADLSSPAIETYDLLDGDGNCMWFLHPVWGRSVDAAVLPVKDAKRGSLDILSAIDAVDPYDKWPLEVGDQLFVLGYPFGVSASYTFPIWKVASLASDPGVDQDDLPLIYVDTATRKGMSGAPVIAYRRRAVSISGDKGFSRFHAAFVGIYSGRIAPTDPLDAQLGKVWKAKCLEEIVKARTRTAV